MAEGKTAARSSIGSHVATPNGFIAEIASLSAERALVRYLSMPPGPGEAELALGLLRPVTARDLFLAIERQRPKAPEQ